MTRLALLALAAMGALVLLGRVFRVEPTAPAPILPLETEDGYVPMAAWMPEQDTYRFGTRLVALPGRN